MGTRRDSEAAAMSDKHEASAELEAERPLFARMMGAIHVKHTRGNRVGFVKLPLILTDKQLYGGAIAQFYFLTERLEARLREHASHPLVKHLLCELDLKQIAPGYEADLAQIFGGDDETWRAAAAATRTAATESYLAALDIAGPVELVGAAFILYGALVIGGGKNTQKRVKRVLPGCDHVLFDVADDMPAARRRFKNLFTQVTKEHAGKGPVAPEHGDALVAHAGRYMTRNNEVVLSVRCVPNWLYRVAAVSIAAVAVVAARRLRGR